MIEKNLKKRIFTSLALLVLTTLFFYFKFVIVYTLIVLGVLSIIEFINLINKISKKIILKFFLNIIFIMYILVFSLFFFYFSSIFQLKILLFLILFTCIASDIGGFVVGKIFKGPKLTKISPKKTISGAVGSIVCSSLTLYIIFLFFLGNSNLKFLLIGAIVSIGCQFGDIFFSYLKRKAKLKDTGKFLPGHGGFLDRIDGILLGIPVGFVALKILF